MTLPIRWLIGVSLLLPILSGTTPVVTAQMCSYTGHRHRVLDPQIRKIALTLCREHFAPGSKAEAAVQAGLDELNAVQGSRLVFSIAGHADHREYHDTLKRDGVFRLDVVKPEPTRSGDATFAGRTVTRSGWRGIVEFDIAFNRRARWNFGEPRSWAMKERPGSFRSVLLHEIGHGLGFSHSHKETPDLSIMGGRCGKWIGMRQVGLKAWDHGHIRLHYSRRSEEGKPDLILGNYRTLKNAKGGWKTILNEMPSSNPVVPGVSLTLAWTRFNTGAIPVRTPHRMRVYLSRDESAGDAEDLLLAEWIERDPVPPSSTCYLDRPITIPLSARPGQWHILITIDDHGQVDELHEDNNLLVLHQRLQVKAQ